MLSNAGRVARAYRIPAAVVAVLCLVATGVSITILIFGASERDWPALAFGAAGLVVGACGSLGFGAAAITGRNMDWPTSLLRFFQS